MADSKLFTMIMFEVQWLPDYFTEMQTHKFVQDSISFFVFFFVFFFFCRYWHLWASPSRKHAYIILTPINLTFIQFIFLILLKNIDCGYSLANIDYGYSLEPPRWGGSNEYPQSMFWAEIWKISSFSFYLKFSYFGGKIFNILE